MTSFFKVNIELKLVSLAIAVLLWAIVNGETDTSFTVKAALNYTLPPKLISTQPLTTSVDLTLKGPLLFTRSMDDLSASFDLSHAKPGITTLSIPKTAFRLPRDMEIIAIEPAFISLVLEQAVTRTLPVSLVTTGDSAKGYQIDHSRSNVTPHQVILRGPRSILAPMAQIFTQPVDITGRQEPFATLVELDFQGRNIYWDDAEQQIKVELFFKQTLTQRTFPLPLQIINTPHAASVSPSTIAVTVEGPGNYLAKLAGNELEARIDAHGKGVGKYRLVPVIRLPAQLKLIAKAPEEVELSLSEKVE